MPSSVAENPKQSGPASPEAASAVKSARSLGEALTT